MEGGHNSMMQDQNPQGGYRGHGNPQFGGGRGGGRFDGGGRGGRGDGGRFFRGGGRGGGRGLGRGRY